MAPQRLRELNYICTDLWDLGADNGILPTKYLIDRIKLLCDRARRYVVLGREVGDLGLGRVCMCVSWKLASTLEVSSTPRPNHGKPRTRLLSSFQLVVVTEKSEGYPIVGPFCWKNKKPTEQS